MKIAIVVHGRYHAFEMARALIDRGHEVRVYTNFPRWAAKRFGLPPKNVESFWPEGVLSRVLKARRWEPMLHKLFGRWAAWRVHRQRWDLIHLFSGGAEEALLRRPRRGELMEVSRGCAHIRVQDRLLEEEFRRCGAPLSRPSDWMMQREEREYALADRVVTLSGFARDTFLERGMAPEKLLVQPLGADLSRFRAGEQTVRERAARIRAGAPLRLVFAGTVSYQKGVMDLITIANALAPGRFEWRAAGSITISAEHLAQLSQHIKCLDKLPQSELPALFAWGDVFVFPTIQDGFAMVLAEAQAGGLPLLSTVNSGGPELVTEGVNGWLLPIRQPQRFIERLQWLDEHREDLAQMTERIGGGGAARTWDDVAQTLEQQFPAAG